MTDQTGSDQMDDDQLADAERWRVRDTERYGDTPAIFRTRLRDLAEVADGYVRNHKGAGS